jgi:hypothetical protein
MALTRIKTDQIATGTITGDDLNPSTNISLTNVTVTGELRGPAVFKIDPAGVGDNTGKVVIAGDLQVDGTTTTINSTTLTVNDKQIVIASGAADATAADGAGILIDGANATLTYNGANDQFQFNKEVYVNGRVGIGTSSPEYRLDVTATDNVNTTVAMSVQNNARNYGLGIGAYSMSNRNIGGIASTIDYTFDIGGDAIFKTANTERLRITDTGNVGIGTSSPNEKLSVAGSAQFTDGSPNIYSLGTIGRILITANASGSTASGGGIALRSVSASVNASGLELFAGGSERLRITSAGNVGIGTSSPSSLTHISRTEGTVYNGSATDGQLSAGATLFVQQLGNANNLVSQIAFQCRSGQPFNRIVNSGGSAPFMAFTTNNAERLRIDSTGNVGINTASPSETLDVNGTIQGGFITSTGSIYATTGIFRSSDGTATIPSIQPGLDNDTGFFRPASNTIGFTTGGQERARINASGNLLVGTTSLDPAVSTGVSIVPSGAGYVQQGVDTATNAVHYLLYNKNATNNGYRFYVSTNGGISNFSGNNVNLSDERTKKNIEVAGGYLGKICAIPVKLFNYKDEAEGEQRTLGVIAQDVEAVAPEFVNNDGWEGTNPEDGVPLKTIYTTDLMFGLMKAIQELSAKVDTLQAELNTLKGN